MPYSYDGQSDKYLNDNPDIKLQLEDLIDQLGKVFGFSFTTRLEYNYEHNLLSLHIFNCPKEEYDPTRSSHIAIQKQKAIISTVLAIREITGIRVKGKLYYNPEYNTYFLSILNNNREKWDSGRTIRLEYEL